MTDPNYTHLLLIVDRSGSMARIADDMNGGIRKLLEEQRDLPGLLYIDAWTFDTEIEHVWDGLTPEMALKNSALVQARGGTALYDAIGKAVTRLGADLAAQDEGHRPGKVLVVIVTDGMENSSCEWDVAGVKKLIATQTDVYSWDFLFLGANLDSFAVGIAMSIPTANSMNWTASSAGVSNVMASSSSYLRSYRESGVATLTEEDREAAMEQ